MACPCVSAAPSTHQVDAEATAPKVTGPIRRRGSWSRERSQWGRPGAGAGAGATVLGRPCVHAATRLTPLLSSSGCQGLWDNTSCWPSSALGQTVEVACPRFLWMLVGRNGNRSAQGPSWEAVGRPSGWAWAWRPEAEETSLGTRSE